MTSIVRNLEGTRTGEVVTRPHLGPILKHLALSLLTANVIPAALFYICLRAGNVWAALIAALVWCYGAMAWRAGTRRRASGLLVVTVVGLTVKTALAFASGSTFLYFVQPAINDVVVSMLFMVSLLTARPIVARLAADFYPMTAEVAGRPQIQRLFWHLTLFWAFLCLIKGAMTLWLLEALPTVTFVAVKSLGVLAVVLVGTAATVYAACRVARSEGLLGDSVSAVAEAG
jgi:intracellular septation protein A